MSTSTACPLDKLLEVIKRVHAAHADDQCWMDIDLIFEAAGLSVPDRRVGDKFEMLRNCSRFIGVMCTHGHWKSYAELESELAALKAAVQTQPLMIQEAIAHAAASYKETKAS